MTKAKMRRRFVVAVSVVILLVASAIWGSTEQSQPAPQTATPPTAQNERPTKDSELASQALAELAIKGRAPRTGYSRDQFGSGWDTMGGCNVRNLILQRDLQRPKLSEDNCTVLSGTLQDPYTGNTIAFMRGSETSQDVQIDHVVALSDAWQKGAQQLPAQTREAFANDPLNLLATDGPTNQKKGDGDAATWLPPSKTYRCRYIARQIAVKVSYDLWVTQAEHDAMQRILGTCPAQLLPAVEE